MIRGKPIAAAHRFMVKLNSVESALTFPHDLIAEHASAIEFDYDAKRIYLRVYEDEAALVSGFIIGMSEANPTLVSQSYRMDFSILAAGGKVANTMIFDGITLMSHRLKGFQYRGEELPEHEIGMQFSTVIIEADAIRSGHP